SRAERAGILGRVLLADPELVEVVVRGHVAVGCPRLVRAVRALDGDEIGRCRGRRLVLLPRRAAPAHEPREAAAHAGAGRSEQRRIPDELATTDPEALGRDLRRRRRLAEGIAHSPFRCCLAPEVSIAAARWETGP